MSILTDGVPINIGGTQYELVWTLGNLRWLKNMYKKVLDKLNFSDPDDVIPFILAGLGGPKSPLNEEQVEDGIDLIALLRFGQEFAKLQEEIAVPLTSKAGSSTGPSPESA